MSYNAGDGSLAKEPSQTCKAEGMSISGDLRLNRWVRRWCSGQGKASRAFYHAIV